MLRGVRLEALPAHPVALPTGLPAGLCGGSSLRERAYTLAGAWPFNPFHLVMEFTPGTCDLYPPATRNGSRSVCCDVAGGDDEEDTPEAHVREAVVGVPQARLERTLVWRGPVVCVRPLVRRLRVVLQVIHAVGAPRAAAAIAIGGALVLEGDD